jgi:cytochrome b
MSEYQNEPSGDTEQFRAFARGGEAESAGGGPNIALILTGVVAVVLVIAVAGYLAFF